MKSVEFSGKTVDEALTNALVSLGTTSDQVDYEVIEEGSAGLFGFGSKDATIRVSMKSSPEDIVQNFLSDVFEKMNLEVEIITKVDDIEGYIEVELKGPEMGVLIGKRGQTLDSLQYLANLALNRKTDDYMRVKIDTEDYRRRRKDTLENLAKNVSYKVKKTRKTVALEAMNPYERRIIHSALQNDKYVETHSEGEEPYRHVVITLKK
ncbi:MAG: protein jag [Lachnospiraceae bacterium]|nr:protein jag [Lachnospiraceae bacterium]